MEKKVKVGAEFFQTQPIYDAKAYEEFATKTAQFGVPVMFGMVIIKSPQMGKFINDKVAGIDVPAALIQEMAAVPQDQYKAKATEITIRLLKDIAPMCQGIHFMPFGWSYIIPEVMAAIKPHLPT
jgi:5,10-methylenetetrahydrofolate reductase